MSESWRDIPGYEGLYQASSLGRIRSLDRVVPTRAGGSRFFKGRVLSHNTNNWGRESVQLCDGLSQRRQLVSRMVFSAFNGAIDDTVDVHHKDEDYRNNMVDNLERVDHGDHMSLHSRGVVHHRAILSEDDVVSIWKLSHDGKMRQVDIGSMYGVTGSTVSNIKCGHEWRHITGGLSHGKTNADVEDHRTQRQ